MASTVISLLSSVKKVRRTIERDRKAAVRRAKSERKEALRKRYNEAVLEYVKASRRYMPLLEGTNFEKKVKKNLKLVKNPTEASIEKVILETLRVKEYGKTVNFIRRTQKKKEEKEKIKVYKPKKSEKLAVGTTTVPDSVEIMWDNIMQMLNNIYYGHIMTSDTDVYEQTHKKHVGEPKKTPGANKNAVRLYEKNTTTIQNILETALLNRMKSGLFETERDAKREILQIVESVFGSKRLTYELERLAYGLYDREYAAWGNGGYNLMTTNLKIQLGV